MATLVHISKAENESSIAKNGIKPGKHSGGIYFMPLTPSYLISHQWVRELKRSGVKNVIAVHFKIQKSEEVWFGRYFETHKKLPLSQAIQSFMNDDEQLGCEFFIERKILPSEIAAIRRIPKPMGWRYQPNAHGKEPCPCPMCIQAGGFKTANLKEKIEYSFSRQEALTILQQSSDDEEIIEALHRMQGKWRRASPEFLERLLSSRNDYLLYSLTELLSEYLHPLARKYLEQLSHSFDEDTRILARQSLERI